MAQVKVNSSLWNQLLEQTKTSIESLQIRSRLSRYLLAGLLASCCGSAFGQMTMTGAIQTANGHFLTAVNGGGLGGPNYYGRARNAIQTNALRVGPAETFRLVWTNRPQCEFALLTANNHFVTAQNTGGIGGPNNWHSPVHTDAVRVGPEEYFTFTFLRGNLVTVLTPDGRHYLSAIFGGGVGGVPDMPMQTDRPVRAEWETFRLISRECGHR